MIIGIDIDDTIAETCEVMLPYAQEYQIDVLKQKPHFNESDCKTHLYVQELLGWHNGEDIDFFKIYYEKIITETKPKTLSVEYLKKLHDEGHKIILITARFEFNNFDVRKLTEDWIKKYDIPCDKLIINAANKLDACREEKVDVFIDDSYSNCKMVSDGGIKTFIMESQGNHAIKDDDIERIYSWPHFYMEINNM